MHAASFRSTRRAGHTCTASKASSAPPCASQKMLDSAKSRLGSDARSERAETALDDRRAAWSRARAQIPARAIETGIVCRLCLASSIGRATACGLARCTSCARPCRPLSNRARAAMRDFLQRGRCKLSEDRRHGPQERHIRASFARFQIRLPLHRHARSGESRGARATALLEGAAVGRRLRRGQRLKLLEEAVLEAREKA